MAEFKTTPQIKANAKKLILHFFDNEEQFVKKVAKNIANNINNPVVGISIPRNVWSLFEDSIPYLYDDETMYDWLVKFGYSPNYLKKLGKYKNKTFKTTRLIGSPDMWGTTHFFIDLIATVGTEIYLDYMKTHGGVIPRASAPRTGTKSASKTKKVVRKSPVKKFIRRS